MKCGCATKKEDTQTYADIHTAVYN